MPVPLYLRAWGVKSKSFLSAGLEARPMPTRSLPSSCVNKSTRYLRGEYIFLRKFVEAWGRILFILVPTNSYVMHRKRTRTTESYEIDERRSEMGLYGLNRSPSERRLAWPPPLP